MNWEKLKKHNYHNDPVPHIHAVGIFDIKEYDRLYENQNNLEHQIWKEFDQKYKTGFEFKEDITNIDFKKEVIALWFFKERTDRGSAPDIDVAGKLIPYFPNTFVLTECKDIKIRNNKNKYIRRPFIQLDINKKQFDQICHRININ
jgi:hypothetical protein